MIATQRFAIRVAVLGALSTLVACSDSSTVTNPASGARPGAASRAAGLVRDAFDVPVSFEGPLDWVTCVDPNDPPLAHVNGVVHIYLQTTPGGVTTTTVLFDIDRDNTWVIYKGLTYHIARGRPGKDDITHTTTTPNGTYIETGLEPDFEVTEDPSQRLRLNFHYQIVIAKDGTVKVAKSTGTCPWNVF